MSDKPEITVQRRRKGSKPTGQASAPGRTSPRPTAEPTSSAPSGYSKPTPSGYSGPSSGYSGTPTGGSSGGSLGGLGSLLGSIGSSVTRGKSPKLGCGCILLIIVAIIVFFALSQCSDLSLPSFTGGEEYVEEPSYTQPTQEVQEPIFVAEPTKIQPTKTTRPPTQPIVSGERNKWLVMVYQDADDQALEQDIFIDMNEMERIGSVEDQVMIVTQIDRFRGGYASSGDFHSTRRYLVTYDDDLNVIGSDVVQDLGEVDMADGDSLVDFVTWAVETYPSEHHVLIMSDHGMGWPGGWTDPNPATRDGGSAPLISALPHDAIYLNELDEALAQIQANTGIEKFDLIGMDACLMSQMEVYMMLQPYARTAVASEETEPGLGWAYSAFLSLLVYDPSIDATQLATNIVETYIDQDERVTDDVARAEFLRQNTTGGGFFGTTRISAEQLAGQLSQNITLTAVNLELMPQVNNALNEFAFALQSTNQQGVANARNYTQSYTSIFGTQVPPSYIDLGHFAAMAYKKTGDANLRTPAQNLLTALDNAIIAEKHGQTKPGSTGVAIYFPNSTLYRSPATGMQSYTNIANRFSKVSLWDDFLVFHYSNRSFKANAAEPVVPSTGMTTRAPGSGQISISQISTSSNTVSAGDSVRLSADISGTNIGYIYLFTGVLYPESNAILVLDTDYLETSQTEELNGIYYPVWPESQSFKMNFDWEPYIFSLSDGTKTIPALFNPGSYGATAEQAVYFVEGTYTFAADGETRQAHLYFMDEKLFKVYGFLGDDTTGAPSEITPRIGDTFTVSYKYLMMDASGNAIPQIVPSDEVLTFGNSPFTWETEFVWPGDYLVGFLVSDHDGQITPGYAQIKVVE